MALGVVSKAKNCGKKTFLIVPLRLTRANSQVTYMNGGTHNASEKDNSGIP